MAEIGINIATKGAEIASKNLGSLQTQLNKYAKELATLKVEEGGLDGYLKKQYETWDKISAVMNKVEKGARAVGDTSSKAATQAEMFAKALVKLGRDGIASDNGAVESLRERMNLYAGIANAEAEILTRKEAEKKASIELARIDAERAELLKEWVAAKNLNAEENSIIARRQAQAEIEASKQAELLYDEQIAQWEEEVAVELEKQEISRRKELDDCVKLVDYLDTIGRTEEVIAQAKERQAQASREQLAHAEKQTALDSLFGKKSNLEKLTEWSKKFGNTVKQILVFRTVMTVMNKAINGFTQLFADSVSVAAEAEQVYSKLNTVFGGFTDSMSKATDLASRLGVSTMTAASALSTVGDLLQAQGAGTVQSLEMATEWVEKFQDIIAFKDIDMSLEEFAQNFMSGAAGNLRNFRTFGSIVKESAVNARLASQGLDTLTGSELELAKMTARAEIALEQQANAIGATGREWDTMLSVQRRLDEETKQLKANLGKWEEPYTKFWAQLKTGILESINDARELRDILKEAYNEDGTRNDSAFTGSASNPIRNANKSFNQDNLKAFYKAINNTEIGREEIMANLTMYGANADDILYLINNYRSFNKGVAETVLQIAKERDALIADAEAKHKNSVELHTLADATDNFLEALQELNGVNFHGSEWYKRLESLMDPEIIDANEGKFRATLVANLSKAVEEATSDITARGYSVAQILFGEDDKGELLQSKVDEYRALYDVLLSAQTNGLGITQDSLDLVKNKWDEVTQSLKEYNDELERQNNYADALSKLSTSGGYGAKLADAQYARRLSSGGMSDDRANAMVSAQREYEAAVAFAKTTDEVRDLIAARDVAIKAINEWFDDVEDLAKKSAEQARKDGVDSGLKDYRGSIADLNFQTSIVGLSDLDAQLREAEYDFDKLRESLNMTDEEYDANKGLLTEYKTAIEANIKALDELAKKEAEEARKEGVAGGIENYIQSISDLNFQTGTVGMTDLGKAYAEANREFEKLRKELNMTDEEYEENKHYLKEYKDAIKRNMEAVERQTKIEEERARKQGVTEGLKGYGQSIEDLVFQGSLLGMDSLEASLEQAQYDFDKLTVSLNMSADEINDALPLLEQYKSVLRANAKIQDDLNKKEAERVRQEKVAGKLGSYGNTVDDLLFSTFTLGMSDLDASLWEASRSFLQLVNDLDMTDEEYQEAYKTYEAYTDALRENYEAQKKLADEEAIAEIWSNLNDRIVGMFGTGGEIYTALKDMRSGDAVTSANGKASIYGILLDLLSQTEAFEKLMNIVDDIVVPILDLALKPLIPVLDLIRRNIVDTLQFLAPVMKAIVEIIGGVQFFLTIIHVAIHNVFEWLKDFFSRKYEANYLDMKTELQKMKDSINGNLESIDKWVCETAENTKTDYGELQRLYAAGLLKSTNGDGGLATYLSQIKGTQYSSTISSSGVQYQKSGNATYLAVNGLVVNMNGVDDPEEFFKNLVKYTEGETSIASRATA